MTPPLDLAPEKSPGLLLLGNPNAGKTTLFNAWSGLRARVGNYPGVTVERRSAPFDLEGRRFELLDLPGAYSLSSRSPEEAIAAEALFEADETSHAAVLVVDGTALARNLYLALQVLETSMPAVVALTMMDDAERQGLSIDVRALEEALGVEVVTICVPKRRGLTELRAAVARALEAGPRAPRVIASDADPAIERVEQAVLAAERVTPTSARAYASWALLSLGGDELEGVDPRVRAAVEDVHREHDPGALDRAIVEARYRFIDALVERAQVDAGVPSRSDRIDRVLTHPVFGIAIFGLVMLAIFEALFTAAEPFMGAIEELVELSKGFAVAVLPDGLFQDMVASGIIAGVGNVIVFVPQIAFLFAFVTLLEDSGYLARVAFVIDKTMKGVGLHGKAFVPLLSGFACAVPAVMSTRTIERRRDRLVTMLALPLMSCSARLPVYILVIATVFPSDERVFGVFRQSTLALFSMYVFSVVMTLTAAAVMRRTILRGPTPSFMLELPPYRMPMLGTMLRTVWEKVRGFLVEAGTVILAFTIILWALLTFPRDETRAAHFEAERERAVATLSGPEAEEALAEIDADESARALRESYAGSFARAIEPATAPLGFDWRLGVGVVASFAAREVFVSTMGMVFALGEDADEEDTSLRDSLREATWPDGRPLMTPLVGVSLMVFFVLAAQCMSTLAVVKRESGSAKWALFLFTYMTVLAWVGSFLVMTVGRALGFT
jgi:ferrous iron transport protein B